MSILRVLDAGPAVTVQDMGRAGHLSAGVAAGGAVDQLSLSEGAALLGQPTTCAALEMAGFGGTFISDTPLRIALTGAPMRALVDDEALAWNAVHLIKAGQRLTIGAAVSGVFGYLSIGGGVETPQILGSRATHIAAGLGQIVTAGLELPLGKDQNVSRLGLGLPDQDRFQGGTLRYVDGPQYDLFDRAELETFQATTFHRDARSNRQGVRLNGGDGLAGQAGLSILSEMITPGDIQITGDGAPYILLADCQTIGGYPRVGTVLPCDLALAAQAPTGAQIRFKRVTLEDAVAIHLADQARLDALPDAPKPRIRDPRDMSDLLTYQMISGMTDGNTGKDTT